MNAVAHLIIVAAAVVIVVWKGRIPWTSVASGCVALAAVAGVLTAVYLLPAHVSLPSPALWLLLTALLEESAKYSAVAPWKTTSGVRRALGVGIGFACTEHLFFLLLPTPLFLGRLVAATTLHMGTVLLYSRGTAPRHHTARSAFFPGGVARVALATAVHWGYNFLLQGLDAPPPF